MDAGPTAIRTCLAVIVLAAVFDVAVRRIPNLLTLGGLALGVTIHVVVGAVDAGGAGALRELGRTLGAIAVCAIVPVMSFVRGEMGGGDVKLFAAIGALCGPALGFDVQAFTYVVLLAIVLPWRLGRHGLLVTSLVNGLTSLRNAFRPAKARLPHVPVKLPPVVMAPAILAGFCIALARHGGLP